MMKRMIPLLLALLALTGCGQMGRHDVGANDSLKAVSARLDRCYTTIDHQQGMSAIRAACDGPVK